MTSLSGVTNSTLESTPYVPSLSAKRPGASADADPAVEIPQAVMAATAGEKADSQLLGAKSAEATAAPDATTESAEETAVVSSMTAKDAETIAKTVDQLNRVLKASDNSLRFAVQSDTGTPYIEVKNEESGEVIRTIPPQYILDFQASFSDMLGLMFDSKA